jgi:putative transcriptional regulator
MGRHLDELLERQAKDPAAARRHRTPRWQRDEEPEGLTRPPRRPSASTPNPWTDPLAGVKPPLNSQNGATRRQAPVEFEPTDIKMIRYSLHATQRQFARMFGISVETLRNWEQGKRRPQGPARALLRVAKANPDEVARTLWRYRRAWWMD